MRTLAALMIFAGLCHADFTLSVSASASGQSCSQTSTSNAYCDVPQPTSIVAFGPTGQAGLQVNSPPYLNGGTNFATLAGSLAATGQVGAGSPGTAYAALSMTFSVPEDWTNIDFSGVAYSSGNTPPAGPFYVTAGGKQYDFPQVDPYPFPSPSVIPHTPGTPETITLVESLAEGQPNLIETFSFAAGFVNAASIPEPASVRLFAAGSVLLALGALIRRVTSA